MLTFAVVEIDLILCIYQTHVNMSGACKYRPESSRTADCLKPYR